MPTQPKSGGLANDGPTRPAFDLAAAPSLVELGVGFAQLGLRGFGGLAPHARYFFVEERKWLDDAAFAELYGISQALPGPNVVGVAIMLGDRYRGPLGSLVAVAGLCLPSLVLAILFLGAIRRLPNKALLTAIEAAVVYAAAGLVIASALKIGAALLREQPGTVDRLMLSGIIVAVIALAASSALPLPLTVVLMLAIGLLFERFRMPGDVTDG